GPMFDFLQRRAQILLQLLRKLLMIPRVGGVARQMQRVAQAIVQTRSQRLKIKHGGNQRDAVERNSLVDEIAGEPRRAESAVALARDKERRHPTRMTRQIHADEFAHRLQIALHAVELARQLRRFRAAETGADGIDEDKVSLVEPGVLILNED